MILYKICCGIAYIFRKLKKLFEYKPKVFKWQVAVCCVLFFLINAFICLFISFAEWFTGFDGMFMLIFGAIIIVFDLIVCYFVIKYINNLDKIIVASGEHKNVEFTDKHVDKSLQTLAKNLENSNEALDKAVAEAIKNEQMKTQLITNVSHDLKTPLTSLINYSDLLNKCEIEDEKAREYIDVINGQSAKLKRLIEDLIEASKVSTGNVQLNKARLNLSELAVQAIVEFTPEFDNNKNLVSNQIELKNIEYC
jgi:signal transduction histidine kinase